MPRAYGSRLSALAKTEGLGNRIVSSLIRRGRDMIANCIALVPEYASFDMRELLRVSAAIQKQIVRDVAPIWGVTATVDPFERLEDVPIGYWPVILTLRDMGGQDGTHLDDDGA